MHCFHLIVRYAVECNMYEMCALPPKLAGKRCIQGQGRIQNFHWGGAAGPGGDILAIEGAPLSFTLSMHYSENYVFENM